MILWFDFSALKVFPKPQTRFIMEKGLLFMIMVHDYVLI